MKKKLLVIGLSALMLTPFAACGGTGDSTGSSTPAHDYVKHDEVAATCETAGNDAYYTCKDCDKIFNADKQEIPAIPTVDALGHDYKIVIGVDGTCSKKGSLTHYDCENCDKIFDTMKNEIETTEGDYNAANHAAAEILEITAQPTKTAYGIGEIFDPAGMVIVHKCENCEGQAIDPQFLTYTYEKEGATSFALDDTKVTVSYGKLSVDVAVSVSKAQAQILGVQENYQTTCGVAPEINVTSNVDGVVPQITFKNANGDVVSAEDFVEGTYTAVVSVAETDTVSGASVEATITVAHARGWASNAADWKKLNYVCACGDTADFYALTYQSPFVDTENLGIDFSKFVVGAQRVSVKSVQQIVRMNEGVWVESAERDGVLTDIDYTNDGMVYSFAAEKYENPSTTETMKPYILTLKVVYEVDGVECPIVIEAKLVDKVLKTKEDLLALAYKGASDQSQNGAAAVTNYYWLANDIDASGLALEGSSPAWHASIGFKGVFEGNGHTISNLSVPAWNNGLFGAIGLGAVLQNVNFTNVTVGEGAYFLAYQIRGARLNYVSIEFNMNSPSYKVANSIDGVDGAAPSMQNITVKTCVEEAPFMINEAACDLSQYVTMQYYTSYTVTFDTDGGTAIAPVRVTENKQVALPENPTKSTDEGEYQFLAWYYGEEIWNFGNAVTEDITLVAKWAAPGEDTGNIVLDARLQTLAKWDYGNAISVSSTTDETYGPAWVVAIDAIAEQSITHDAVNVSEYEKVYFHVYNPCAHQVRLVIHGGWNAWAAATIELAAGAWTKVEVDVASTFDKNNGVICLVLQDPNAASVGGEWKITSFYGLKAGENAPEVEQPDSNVVLDARAETLAKWDYGNAISVSSTTDETYGPAWVVAIDAIAEQSITHDAVNVSEYEKVYFHVYNPCAHQVRLVIHGGWNAWAAATIELAAGAWTKVEVDVASTFDKNNGVICLVLQDPNAVSVGGEWKITSFYGA